MLRIKEIYVIRHGIADDATDHNDIDAERQLTKKGREKVKGVVKYLQSRRIRFDIVVSSPLVRARETAEIFNNACSRSRSLAISDLLMPDGSYDELITFLNNIPEEHVAIVGHEPFLSGFVSYCLSRSSMPYVRMKKAGVACLTCENTLQPGDCVLAWLMGPAQMLAEE